MSGFAIRARNSARSQSGPNFSHVVHSVGRAAAWGPASHLRFLRGSRKSSLFSRRRTFIGRGRTSVLQRKTHQEESKAKSSKLPRRNADSRDRRLSGNRCQARVFQRESGDKVQVVDVLTLITSPSDEEGSKRDRQNKAGMN